MELNERGNTPSAASFNQSGARIKLTGFGDSHLGDRFDFSVGHKNFNNFAQRLRSGLAMNSCTQGLCQEK